MPHFLKDFDFSIDSTCIRHLGNFLLLQDFNGHILLSLDVLAKLNFSKCSFTKVTNHFIFPYHSWWLVLSGFSFSNLLLWSSNLWACLQNWLLVCDHYLRLYVNRANRVLDLLLTLLLIIMVDAYAAFTLLHWPLYITTGLWQILHTMLTGDSSLRLIVGVVSALLCDA